MLQESGARPNVFGRISIELRDRTFFRGFLYVVHVTPDNLLSLRIINHHGFGAFGILFASSIHGDIARFLILSLLWGGSTFIGQTSTLFSYLSLTLGGLMFCNHICCYTNGGSRRHAARGRLGTA